MTNGNDLHASEPAAASGQALSDHHKDAVKVWVPRVRTLLENEFAAQLGRLGLSRDGKHTPLDKMRLPDDAVATRRRVEALVARDTIAEGTHQRGYDNVKRELTYTLLNRLVGLKAMEARNLLYLAPPERPTAPPERTEVVTPIPGQARSRYLRDFRAAGGDRYKYEDDAEEALLRDGLTAAFHHVTREIRILFDPDHEYASVWPTHGALASVLKMINEDLPDDAYRAQDFLGWVYQFFRQHENDELRQDNKGIPRTSYELGVMNQFYTPGWVVKALVDNSLGRLWLQMHPDSSLGSSAPKLPSDGAGSKGVADYLVPRTGEGIRYQRLNEAGDVVAFKRVLDIALLDPACGTMHFGQYAFGLFYRMYLEEIEHAGQPGWPVQPSVTDPRDIPVAILENNLFGIDIDPRAIQIAALSLMLTAKEVGLDHGLSPLDVRVRRMNLVVANAVDLGEEKIRKLVHRVGRQNGATAIRERLFSTLWENLQNVGELGSLVLVREGVAKVLAEWVDERAHEKGLTRVVSRQSKQGVFAVVEEMDRERAQQMELERHLLKEEARQLALELLTALEAAASAAADDPTDRLFAEDTARGLKLIQTLSRSYDVVVMNPPYGAFVPRVKEFVRGAYPLTYNDIYAAFIDRATMLIEPEGYIGALVSRTFVTHKTHERLAYPDPAQAQPAPGAPRPGRRHPRSDGADGGHRPQGKRAMTRIVWRWEEKDFGFRFRQGKGVRANEHYQARKSGEFYVVPGAHRKLSTERIEELSELFAVPASVQVVASPWRNYDRDWNWIDTEDGICLNWAGCLDQAEIHRREDEGVQRSMELVANLVERLEPVALSTRLIQQIHAELMTAIYPFAGSWRTVALHRGDGPTKWPLPPPASSLSWTSSSAMSFRALPSSPKRTTTVFSYASEVMNELLAIHPFREGNGRTVFIVGNLILMQNNMLPLTTYERRSDETRYFAACEAGRIRKDYAPLAALLCRMGGEGARGMERGGMAKGRRVNLRGILASPDLRRELMVQSLQATQAREGIDTTREQAERAYRVVTEVERTAFFDLDPFRGGKGESDRRPEAFVSTLRGENSRIRFDIVRRAFGEIDGAPLAYRRVGLLAHVFRENPRLEPAFATVRQGLSTADDARFVRFHWEVLDTAIGPDRDWWLFAKGGDFSRFYQSFDLVVLWRAAGQDIKDYNDTLYGKGGWSRQVRSVEFYGKAGLTWPLRTQRGFNVRAMPVGCIFGHKGPAIFPFREDDSFFLLGVTNSILAEYVLGGLTSFGSWEVGVVKRLPIPRPTFEQHEAYRTLAEAIHDAKAAWDQGNETSTRFRTPWLLRDDLVEPESSIPARLDSLAELEAAEEARIQRAYGELNDEVYKLYAISDSTRSLIEETVGERPAEFLWPQMEGKSAEQKTDGARPGVSSPMRSGACWTRTRTVLCPCVCVAGEPSCSIASGTS